MNRLRKLGFFALLAFVCLGFASEPALAAEAAARYLKIPVFFLTDRNLATSKTGALDFGPFRKYIGECKHDPFMGSATCVVENVDGKLLDDRLKALGWAEAEGKPKLGEDEVTLIKGDSFEDIEKQFYGMVKVKTLLADDKNIFVLAHGYKNSFRSGLGTAARFAYNAERPLVFYSWPSAAKLRGYNTDENNVEWSQEHFNDFIVQMNQLCADNPSLKMRLFAHSMGTRLVVRATPFLREKPHLIECGLICPDIDDGLVKHYARRYLSVKGTTEIRLYMSRRDKALALSQLIHGGYTRLGEQADALGDVVADVFGGGHNLALSKEKKAEAAVEDAEFAERLNKTKKRMQTIDFTAIDKGLIGHNVPAKLICSMSYTGTPGPGLSLVMEKSGKRSGMSNMFTKMAKLNKFTTKDDIASMTGGVYLVTKDEPVHKHKAVTAGGSPDSAKEAN